MTDKTETTAPKSITGLGGQKHSVVKCVICNDTGWNHGAQCHPSKAHPKGWRTIKCDCAAGKKS